MWGTEIRQDYQLQLRDKARSLQERLCLVAVFRLKD